MDQRSVREWSVREDRPYMRQPRTSPLWWIVLLIIAAIVAVGFYLSVPDAPAPAPAPVAETRAPEPAAPPAASEELAAPRETQAAKSLPALDNSDALMRDTVTGLVGRKAFDEWVYPKELVRRIVATVDNLPRETAPRRVMPLERVPGAFAAAPESDGYVLSKSNDARYSPYVRVFEAIDSRALVQRYVDAYPLFQRAYAELGFPNQRFHDRLLIAIDDMLAAPEVSGPVRLVQPKVLYQFADPELEGLSAGRKIMVRMGTENAAKVKAKLREIRRLLSAR